MIQTQQVILRLCVSCKLHSDQHCRCSTRTILCVNVSASLWSNRHSYRGLEQLLSVWWAASLGLMRSGTGLLQHPGRLQQRARVAVMALQSLLMSHQPASAVLLMWKVSCLPLLLCRLRTFSSM